ncbi:MAG: hypothetical protein QOF53_4133 [Nocardioidaceae bacterium]|jgi:hypothetical protein|nr:hypothetical protein [Nocardioidaceae bacterium]
MAKKEKEPKKAKPKKEGRLKQMALVYSMTRKSDPRIGLILGGVFVVCAAVAFLVLVLILPGSWVLSLVTAVMIGLLATMIVFGRRAQKAQYAEIEGRPGAAAAVLGQLRRGWKVEPGIAFNKNQDLVHRVVGPPGIVLVGEGSPQRLRTLLASERRKHERVASETPIFEVVSGEGPGAVPVPKLTKHVTKLGRNIKPAEMTDVLQRLKALDATRSNLPIPKGPVPTNLKGARQNMRGR